MLYDPEGPVAKQLAPLLVNELTSTFGIAEDAQDVAEYINVLIGNNKLALEICAEVKEVVNIPIDEQFVGRIFTEIGRLSQQPPEQQQQQQPVSQPQQIQPQQLAQPQVQPQVQAQPFPSFDFTQNQQQQIPQQIPQQSQIQSQSQIQPPSFPVDPASIDFSAFAPKKNVGFKPDVRQMAPAGPKGRSKGGIGKDYTANPKKKGLNTKNVANLNKALALSSHAQSVDMAPFVPRAPKGRCTEFPWCRNRECKFSHPAKKCFAYPNCPNPPGTCDYLHPSEDGELMAELEKSKQQMIERKKERFQPQVTLCKYGILCSKELCPFGHPTPANKDAKVIIQKWCRENKNCENPQCEFAHSSPNYQAPAAPPKQNFAQFQPRGNLKYTKPTPTSLEQCKFGQGCTNQQCPKRHATSNVACRNGANCTIPYCTFSHPIEEECRFGDECKNKFCFFRHANGKEKLLFEKADATSQRSFAVPDDQVMEQAVQE